ncbi:hypothetical protein ES703_123256 [subsurface metagenome]
MVTDDDLEQETEEEPGCEEAEEEPAPPAEEAKPKEPTDEIKVLIVVKADNVFVGLMTPTCDPIYHTFTGTMAAALKKIPGFIQEAHQQWDANPRYPKANLPTPEPAPAPARSSTRTPAQQAPSATPSFF